MNGQRPFYDPRTFAERIRDSLSDRDYMVIFISVLVATISSILVFKNVFNTNFFGIEPLDIGVNALFSVFVAMGITLILIIGLFLFEVFTVGLIEFILDLKNKFGVERIALVLLILWFIYNTFLKS